MAKSDTLRSQRLRGERAERALKELGEVFAELREEALRAWEGSDGTDKDGRDNLYWFIRALNEVKGKLEWRVRKGRDASKEKMQ